MPPCWLLGNGQEWLLADWGMVQKQFIFSLVKAITSTKMRTKYVGTCLYTVTLGHNPAIELWPLKTPTGAKTSAVLESNGFAPKSELALFRCGQPAYGMLLSLPN